MQTKTQIEDWYSRPDPWEYENNPDDLHRKEVILSHIKRDSLYARAVDIGAGEGWITKDLPAVEIHAVEWSDKAASRLPPNVKRVLEPEGKYDLIIATGVLYPQYDYLQITRWIEQHASGIVLTSNIEGWEINLLDRSKLIAGDLFKYREYMQHLCVYDYSTPA